MRTSRNTGCPYCAGRKLLKGFNDLQTRFPEIAKEANGWDPSTITAGVSKKLEWKCKEGHIYLSIVGLRTGRGSGCPVCSGQQILKGFNDLQSKHPEIAAEAYGWDPSTVAAGTKQKKDWICNLGHIYLSLIHI